jgi:hypothetical protein
LTWVSRPTVRLPEPGRCWVRYTPRHWPTPGAEASPWTNLAEVALGRSGKQKEWGTAASQLRVLAELPLDDVLYLPPVAAGNSAGEDFEALRRRVAEAQGERGTPLLYQLFPGEAVPGEAEGAAVVFDLLPVILGWRMGEPRTALEALPPGSVAVWPLIPGVSDDAEDWRQGCERLAAAGVVACQPLALQMQPKQRRRLAERLDEAVFSALFHHPPPSERAFARCAAEHGLEPFLPRPLPRAPRPVGENRRLGGELALIGELWHRLGHTGSRGAGFYRASRWLDATTYDVAALVREGNLGVVEPLDAASREVIEQVLESGTSQLLQELKQEYLHASPPRDTIPVGGNQ